MRQARAFADRRWRVAAFWLAFAPIGLVCAIFYLSVPPSPDQSIFDEIGLMSILGHPYYGGAFDISWPGPFVYHELGIRLFGIHGWTARATDLCLLPIGLAGLWLLADRAGYRAAAAALLLLYPIVYVTSGPWMAGHRDMVGMHMLLLAAGLLSGSGRARRWQLPLAGALIAYATMVRPTYLFALLPLWLIEMRRQPDVRARVFGTIDLAGGMIAVFALFLIGGVRHGAIGDWYQQAVLFPVTIYQVPESRWRLIGAFAGTLRALWAWLAPAAATGLVLWAGPLRCDDRPRSPLAAYVGSLAATVIVSYVVQNKGFGYHLGGLIPLFMLCSVIGIEAGWAGARRAGGWRALLLYALLGVTALAIAAGTLARVRNNLGSAARLVAHADTRGIADYIAHRDDPVEAARVVAGAIIRAGSSPADRVLQWGWNYEAAFLSGRASATRFVNTVVMPAIPAGDPRFTGWLQIFADEMASPRIRFVLLDTSVPPVAPAPDTRTRAAPALHTVELLIRSGYRVRYRGARLLLLERSGR